MTNQKSLRALPTPLSDLKVGHFEGAVARVPDDATAFPHRHAPFLLNINTRWQDHDPENRFRVNQNIEPAK